MRTSLPAAEAVDNWFRLYKTAIFESNKEVRSRRIAEAERAIAQREHALFPENGAAEERRALEAAQCALQALRSVSDSSRYSKDFRLHTRRSS